MERHSSSIYSKANMQEGKKRSAKQIVSKAELIIIILRKWKEKRIGNSILLQVLCYYNEVK